MKVVSELDLGRSAEGNMSAKVNSWLSLLALALTVQAASVAAQPVRTDNVEAEFVSASDAVVPGQPLVAGLRLKHDEHLHTYWQVPGDSGLPTRIQWKLPPGWAAGPIEWPLP